MGGTKNTEAYRRARDLLVTHRDDYATAYERFTWPNLSDPFNWAHDWFDRDPGQRPAGAVDRRGGRSEADVHLRRDGRRAPTRWPAGSRPRASAGATA